MPVPACLPRAAILAAMLLGAAAAQSEKPPAGAAADEFFRAGKIPRLVIELDDDACERLRAEPRAYVVGRLRENGRIVCEGVSVKLKGAAGSFREFDDEPSLTLSTDRVEGALPFHGLRKFHLNRSLQDDTWLRELLGAEIFAAAGVLTPRAAHARVWINGREMGVYVLKEGFDRELLRRGFAKTRGNLYDGGFCQDIDAELERDAGRGPEDRADLRRLLGVCREPDLKVRWKRLPEVVDVKELVTFMALELMLGHWDGYCQNRNNYRLYFDPADGRAVFLPHGMDQILQDAGASILDNPGAIVADAVMKNPAWRAEFRRRVGELLPLFGAEKLSRRVDAVCRRLRPALAAWDPDRADAHDGAVAGLKEMLAARERSLREQKSLPDPKPLVFKPGVPVRVGRWRTASECEDAELSVEKVKKGELMRIACGRSGRCVASFRRSVLLARGRYRFQAQVRVRGVERLEEEGAPGTGAGLRISGGSREGGLAGSTEWREVAYEFEVEEEARDVELVVELRCRAGSLSVKAESVWLTRVE